MHTHAQTAMHAFLSERKTFLRRGIQQKDDKDGKLLK
jgi:hypothetical protein